MKKSLIALAVVGTLVAPVAMADTSNVNVYGQVNLSLDMVKSGETGGSVSANQVSSNESRLGFKGSEDLGGGVSAIFQIESDIAADGTAGGSVLASRNTFGGLKSDVAGSLTLGKQDTPYKISTRNLDLFGGTIADNRSLMGDSGALDLRATDSINYMSPSMGGFSIAAAYAMGAEGATTTAQSKGKLLSIAGMYDMGPFYATIAQEKVTRGSATGQFPGATGDSDKAFKLGGGFKMDMFAVNAVVEAIKSVSGGGATENKVRNIYVAGQFNITSSDAIKLAITKMGNDKKDGVTQTDTGARQMSVGYDHNLSKRTTVYALYTKLSNQVNQNARLIGQSSSGGPASFPNDADPSAFSFGMKHSF